MTDAVAFDASFLLPVFSRNLHAVPRDPSTGNFIEQYDKKIDHLLSRLEKEKTKMLIPAPTLSEILIRVEAEEVDDYLKEIFSGLAFSIASFEKEAAIEVAMMGRKAKKQGDKRSGSTEVWSKVKFDRQIIAIAKVGNTEVIYSDDKNLRNFAEQAGLNVISSHELELPP